MIRFATLYSGSSGNSTVIWDGDAVLLVDMGGSCRRTITALNALGIPASSVKGILITHEHSDHIAGLEVFCRHYQTTLYGTKETKEFLQNRNMLHPGQRFRVFRSEEELDVAGFTVVPFATPHDSITCHGFTISKGLARLAVATDLGKMDSRIYSHLSGCSLVALESNYDETDLRKGPYPPDLKARIAGPQGHLSNMDCALTAADLVNDGMKTLVLMHLSEENNTPAKALTAVIGMFENRELAEDCCEVYAAPRYEVGTVWEIG